MANSDVFAVIATGGKQYRVKVGDIIKVEKLNVGKPGEGKLGAGKSSGGGDGKNDGKPGGGKADGGKPAAVAFDTVLMVGDKIGAPTVPGAVVSGEVLEQKRTDKIIVFKRKRRKNYRRTRGHRQHITVVRITGIKN